MDGGYKRNKVGQLLDLIPLCDTITKLNALCTICKDGTRAPFTFRKTKVEDENNLVGGKDDYSSLCRKHYIFMQQDL